VPADKSTATAGWPGGLGGLVVGVLVGVAFAATRQRLRSREPIKATYDEICLEPQDYPTR
jgi:hypothetical protein